MERDEIQLEPYRLNCKYFLTEWEMFNAEPERAEALLEATRKIQVERVLDIGCGAGQQMLPFVAAGAAGFGVDVLPGAGAIGRELFAREGLLDRAHFLLASGTNLPFADGSFDVLISRGALMYMDNKTAIKEMGRVLGRQSRLFLKYHAPPYYWAKVFNGLRNGHIKSAIHACRVLYTGYVYLFTDKQYFGWLTAAGETFQTERILRRELARVGLKILEEMPDSNVQTPSVVIIKD